MSQLLLFLFSDSSFRRRLVDHLKGGLAKDTSTFEANHELNDSIEVLLAKSALKVQAILLRSHRGGADLAGVTAEFRYVAKFKWHGLLQEPLDQVLFVVQESTFTGDYGLP